MDDALWTLLIGKLTDVPGFLAAELGTDVPRLAARLQITPQAAKRLLACRTPRSEHYQEDLEALALVTGAEQSQLEHLLFRTARGR